MKITSLTFFLAVPLFLGLEAQQVDAKWELKETPVRASLRGLSVFSDEVVWASGSGGTWLRTTNAGASWEHGVIAGLDTVDFRSIHAIDEETAVAVSAGTPAVIYKTTDGGKSWSLKSSLSPPAFLDGIHFVDAHRGYVFGDPMDGKWVILATKDGGETWELVDQVTQVAEGEAGFAASGSSLIASNDYIWIGSGGAQSAIWQSADQGSTWEVFVSPFIQGQPSQGIFAMCLADDQRVIAVGGDYLVPEGRKGTSGIFLMEDDDWGDIITQPNGYRSGITFLKGKKWAIAVGTNGSDISTDLGENWLFFSNESFHAVKSDVSGHTAWASGGGGKIGRLIYK